ncbi:ROK family protein [Phyllobacterium myrsinacearum]|uniref:Glucokinase n=1 Tax=Phyllobacterium myrsinacearum TaxID=28101 RepID=A0A839EN42_9HYPH|nr:ROK family protein [Phyllobacterium myrsinacearum]MBA8879625.1 glucokinase [Phyllobacterium myrsinacearum]
MAKLLGLDIGGTKTAAVIGTEEGAILQRIEFTSRATRGPEALIDDILTAARRLMDLHPGVVAAGVSVGGPVDVLRGHIQGPPNLPGWHDVPLREWLSNSLNLPVAVEHDAKAGALAEWRFGAGRDCNNLVFLTLGTGLGAGIIADGRLLRGTCNLAGEIGHWRVQPDGPLMYGKRGSFEGMASGAGLPALAAFLYPERATEFGTALALNTLWKEGDRDAEAVIIYSADILGRGIALMIDLLAPERVILGGLGPRLGPDFIRIVHDAAAADALPGHFASCEIVSCQLADNIGDMAALSVAEDLWRTLK